MNKEQLIDHALNITAAAIEEPHADADPASYVGDPRTCPGFMAYDIFRALAKTGHEPEFARMYEQAEIRSYHFEEEWERRWHLAGFKPSTPVGDIEDAVGGLAFELWDRKEYEDAKKAGEDLRKKIILASFAPLWAEYVAQREGVAVDLSLVHDIAWESANRIRATYATGGFGDAWETSHVIMWGSYNAASEKSRWAFGHYAAYRYKNQGRGHDRFETDSIVKAIAFIMTGEKA